MDEGLRDMMDSFQEFKQLDLHNILENLHNIAPSTELNSYLAKAILSYEKQNLGFQQYLKERNASHCAQELELEAELSRLVNKQKSLQDALRVMQDIYFKARDKANSYKTMHEKFQVKEKYLTQNLKAALENLSDPRLRNELVHIFGPPLDLDISQLQLSTVDDVFLERYRTQDVASKPVHEPYAVSQLEELKLENKTLRKINKSKEEELEVFRKEYDVTLQETAERNRYDAERIESLLKKLKDAEDRENSLTEEMLNERMALKRERILFCVKSCILQRCVDDLIYNAGLYGANIDFLQKVSQAANRAADLQNMVASCEPSRLLDEIYEMLKLSPVSETAPRVWMTSTIATQTVPDEDQSSKDRDDWIAQSKETHKRLMREKGTRHTYYEAYEKLKEEYNFVKRHQEAYIAPFKEQNEALIEEKKKREARNKRNIRSMNLQMEGLKTDMMNLHKKMKKMEKNSNQMILLGTENNEADRMLEAIHASTRTHHHAARELKRLRTKLYQVEVDMRHR